MRAFHIDSGSEDCSFEVGNVGSPVRDKFNSLPQVPGGNAYYQFIDQAEVIIHAKCKSLARQLRPGHQKSSKPTPRAALSLTGNDI